MLRLFLTILSTNQWQHHSTQCIDVWFICNNSVTHTQRTARALSEKNRAVRRCASMNFVRI